MAKTLAEFNPRPYMELAIEEMRKSQNEPRDDGKVPPQVGAILVMPNGDVHRAYRGELRDGDHAEYTLLERKLAHMKLDEGILFTTLEPCVKRSNPKVACCKRTSKARIKTVYVGIEDPDPTVDGKGIEHLIESGATVVMFDSDLQKQIREANKEFLDQAVERKSAPAPAEKSRPMEQSANKGFGDLSAEALQRFIIDARLNYRIEDQSFQQYLIDLGALVKDSGTDEPRATMAGILLFGFEPRLLYKQASLHAHIKYPDGRVEQTDFDGPLVLIPEQIEAWLKKVLPVYKDTSSFKRADIMDFPIEVLREAVINAIVHRDYNIEGAKAYLEIDSEKIVVKSPGGPLPVITLDQLNTFSAPSISRNPIITYVFGKMDYVEEKGFGMQSLKSLNSTYDLPLPEYTYNDPFLTLTFPRNMEAVKSVSAAPGIKSLTEEEIKGYEFIKASGSVSRSDYEKEFGLLRKSAERQIKRLVDLSLIVKEGGSKNTVYKAVPIKSDEQK
ncbi:hypothetical protein KHS38_12905 [Mucilaginibacter sp. Bleaf8]|uniref:ATP-binding protein n=1 Tax=Mucilaginibacter sp. Bleaf8 TaxID=2834430 RepID=UPI001BCC46E6|nr:ATP-binding protein [Mucilaginibacter sp. Bleaf8]MBS7565305.1 hypothetical protein [Mucilaginibacter sp. Bleaf8]